MEVVLCAECAPFAVGGELRWDEVAEVLRERLGVDLF